MKVIYDRETDILTVILLKILSPKVTKTNPV